MANYNKSFNFRNGVQVDEDDLIVRSSLVGIGTTIPRAELDVYGTIKGNGLVTTTNLYVSGIATFNDIQIGTGITIVGNSGTIIAKFYGDGAGLYNIPTSQWVDVDPAIYPGVGLGYSSIWAGGTVGIGTTIPRSWLQIGGDPILGQNGVGISSDGNINASGIITAGYFVGSGASVTSINASNISSGTLDNSRLSSNVFVSGVITATTFNGHVNAGVGTITTLNSTNGTISNLDSTNLSGTIGTIATLTGTIGTITNLTSTNLTGTIGTITTLDSTNSTITNLSGTIGTITNLISTNLSGTIATITTLNSTNATITNLSGTIGTITNLTGNNLNYSGVGTIGSFSANQATIGVLTATNSKSGSIQLGVIASNQIDTISGNLVLDSVGGLVDINNNLDVSGTSILGGEVTVNTGIIPDTSSGAYLGKNEKEFLQAWIGDFKIAVGVGNSNKIETVNNDLVLDSNTNLVNIDSNLVVAGITTLTGNLTLGSGIEPATDLGTTLGTSLKRFSSSQIGAIRVGFAQTNEIDTLFGTDLILNSSSGTTRINDNLFVDGNSSFSGEIQIDTGLVADTSKGAYIGTSGAPFSEAFIDEIRIGVGETNKIDTREGSLLLNGANNLVNVENNLLVSGISTLSGNLFVGSNNEFIVNTTLNRIGIGITNSSASLGIKRSSAASLEIVSDLDQAFISIGQSVGVGQSTGLMRFGLSPKSFDIMNNDTGDFSSYLHAGPAGIGTGKFKWIYGQSSTELMSLNYDGKFIVGGNVELGIAGISSVTINDDLKVKADLDVEGILSASQFSFPSIIDGINLNTSVGVSTFNSLIVNQIGINTTENTIGYGFDALGTAGLIGSVGVGTTSIDGNALIHCEGFARFNQIGIGTTSLYALEGQSTGVMQIHNDNLKIFNGGILIDSREDSAIGFGTIIARSVLDFGIVGSATSYGYFIPPTVSTTDRGKFANTSGLTTVRGAIIFNSSTNKHQGFDGTTWNDLY